MKRDGLVRSEPVLCHMIDQLAALLEHLELLADGEVVEPTQVRLRHPEAWVRPVRGVLLGNIGSLSPHCTCSCDFCYIKGNCPGMAMDDATFPALAEIECRAALRRDGHQLFQYLREYGEPLRHPEALQALRAVREASPAEVLCLSTNGTRLTRETVASLAELKPVHLFLSLNTADHAIRRRLMHDAHPEVAVGAPELLREHGLAWFGGIVAWPSVPLADLEQTVRLFDATGAQVIRVALPSATRYHPEVEGLGMLRTDWRAHWDAVLHCVQNLRQEAATPIYVQPHSYEQGDFRPVVVGTVRNSPAERAGVRAGDVVLRVNGRDAATRDVCIKMLALCGASAVVTLAREGRSFEVSLHDGDDTAAYPYRPPGYGLSDHQGIIRSFGICLPDDLCLPAFHDLRAIVAERQAQQPVVVSSWMKAPAVRGLLDQLGLTSVAVAEVPSLTLGGNIQICDLLTAEDIITHFRDCRHSHDLIVVPSSLFSNGIDLVGRTAWEIALELGIDVALVHCPRILT